MNTKDTTIALSVPLYFPPMLQETAATNGPTRDGREPHDRYDRRDRLHEKHPRQNVVGDLRHMRPPIELTISPIVEDGS